MISIDVFAYVTDDQSGGADISIYSSLEELQNEESLDDEIFEEALEGSNFYDSGEIISNTIEIDLIDGKYTLTSPIHFHVGQ